MGTHLCRKYPCISVKSCSGFRPNKLFMHKRCHWYVSIIVNTEQTIALGVVSTIIKTFNVLKVDVLMSLYTVKVVTLQFCYLRI